MADESAAPAPTQAATDAPEGSEEQPQQSSAEQKLSRQFAAMARKEKAFKAERATWEKERDAGRGELSRLAEMRGKAPNNIGAWLQAGNISPQQLHAFLSENTNRANDPYEKRLSEETRGLKEQLDKYAQELQEMKNNHIRGQNIDKINALVQAKPDDFELIRHYGAQSDVVELMDLWLAEKGEKITEAEACSIIERTIEDRDDEVVRRALAARKIAKRIGWQPPGEDAESQPGDDDGDLSPESPQEKQRSTPPTRGKPKLTNASPSSGRRKPEVKPSGDPYDDKWDHFKASKTKRR